MDQPIIESLDDLDQYKRTMRQFILQEAPDAPVTWGLTCRTRGIRLVDTVPLAELREQLDHARTLRFTPAALDYARRQAGPDGRRYFSDEFVEAETAYRLPEYELTENGQGGLRLRVGGGWGRNTYWETLALSIVTELHTRNLAAQQGLDLAALEDEGMRRLDAKIDVLQTLADLMVLEFGTRRRASRRHQRRVFERLLERLPGRVATSNVAMARELGLDAKGTMAHEPFMVLAALAGLKGDDALRASQREVLEKWYGMYGEALSIALSDTFGSEAFFQDFRGEMTRLWRGPRNDSGNPFVFGEAVLRFYETQSIDSRTKSLVFSDGLDLATVVRLHALFWGLIRLIFGWGTNLTNDIGLPPLSLVMKVEEAGGVSTVKLTDNPAKSIGSAAEVVRYKRVFNYSERPLIECVY